MQNLASIMCGVLATLYGSCWAVMPLLLLSFIKLLISLHCMNTSNRLGL